MAERFFPEQMGYPRDFTSRVISHERDSGFTFGGMGFDRTRAIIDLQRWGMFECDFYDPHARTHHSESVGDHAQILMSPDISGSTRSVHEYGVQSSFYYVVQKTMGKMKGLDYLAAKRDALGRFERIAVINLHGGGRPWQVAAGIDGREHLGAAQDLVDQFLAAHQDQYDRVLLEICNDRADNVWVKQPGVVVNFVKGISGMLYNAAAMEASLDGIEFIG